MPIFQKSVLKKHLKDLDDALVEKAFKTFLTNYSASKIEAIKNLKEEEYQDGFLRDLFVDVLGYTLRPEENYNLQREFKNQTDGKKADGAIIDNNGMNPIALAVIELKSTKTKDLTKVTQQAFNYKNNQLECKYVITSNFHKLRFYIDYANEYEEFDLFQLGKEDFKLLYLLLCKESVFTNLPLQLKDETKFHEQEISDKLYNDYSKFKRKLYDNLTKNQPNSDKLTLFKKSQKLLDRFLFILFAEDSGLLPPNSISEVIKRFNVLKENDAYKPVYEIFKQYFGYMNIGRKGKTAAGDIPAYNGGLFYEDKELDNFKIDDEILIDDLLNLSEYDFSTEVDVNILGHIFEHSLNEIEEITAKIEATSETRGLIPLQNNKTSKRKKDGVFYTPKYITQYIVENTVGTLCNEKRQELHIEEIEFDGTYRNKSGKLSEKGKKLYKQLTDYKDWLITLKIIDPACGSGAFLNQALNFLIAEHTTIDDIIAELTNSPLRLFDVDKMILENNLFGVDINEESVDIARLSLWLRTAQKGRKLSSLNNNIKCGNSLINNPEIAGDKAFDWNKEFPQIFKEKEKKPHHITWVTHNSRTSQRMIDHKVKKGDALWLDNEWELNITKTISEIIEQDKLNVLAYNICGDHVHLLLVCEDEEVPNIIRKLKGKSSQKLKEHLRIPKEEQFTLWAQKYSNTYIDTEEKLNNTITYIQTNRKKHELHSNKGLQPLVDEMCCSYNHAFRTEYKGGFDCVIGNPPYVRSRELFSENEKNYYLNNFETVSYQLDLYKLFIEKSCFLINQRGRLSFITPSVFLTNDYDKPLRKFLLDKFSLDIIATSDEDVFQDASVKTVVFLVSQIKPDNLVSVYKIYNSDFHINNKVPQQTFINQGYLINERINISAIPIIEKMNTFSKIGQFYEIKNGIKVRKDLLFNSKRDDNHKPFLLGKNIFSFQVKNDDTFIDYKSGNEKLYTNQAFRTSTIFEQDKLITRQILGKRIVTCFDNQNYYTDQTTYVINKTEANFELKYLLSLLNSRLTYYYFQNTSSDNKTTFPKVKRSQLLELPFVEIPQESQQPFIEKADKMLALNEELQTKSTRFIKRLTDNFELQKTTKKLASFYEYDFKTLVAELKKQKINLSLVQQDEWEEYFTAYQKAINEIQQQITTTDKEIDKMVYELYELTASEIKIVEGS